MGGTKKENNCQYTIDTFLDIVRRYTDTKELSQRMVTELIDHIDVCHAKQIDGLKTQEVKIHYNCIGAFEVPAWESIPELVVYMTMRKGVALSFSPKAGQRNGVFSQGYSDPIRTLRIPEEKGFEPLRRQNRPTGFRIRTLQPLGYSSVYMLARLPLKNLLEIEQTFGADIANIELSIWPRNGHTSRFYAISLCILHGVLQVSLKSFYEDKVLRYKMQI